MVHKIFIAISILWVLSEILIGRLTYHRSPAAKNCDRQTLRWLWVTISLSVTAGAWLGMAGVGHLPALNRVAPPLAVILVLSGLLIRWTAFITLRRYFTSNVAILENHQLVQHGIYGIIRHPAYAGSLLSFLGLGIYFRSWVSLLVIFVPILLVFLKRIQTEERALQEAFGDAYRAYSQSVKRLIPKIF
ncbi:MAG: hypothetical protein Kow0042_30830 [Calditrichia bacterium]